MKFVNPKNDVAFKKIFGSEDKTDILISFLNAVLGLTGDKQIQQVQLLNPYQTPKLQQLKMTILDIRVVDKRNVSYIIEMQLENVEDLEFVFVELPKFTKQEADVSTLLDKWLYFIKHAEDLAVIPPHVDDPALQSAYQVADQFGWSQEDLEAYEYRGMRIQDARGAVQLAHELGLQEGERLGLKKGEHRRALETARRMKADGLTVELIAKYTGLSTAEIEGLASDER